MVPELGQFALALALSLAIVQVVVPFAVRAGLDEAWLASSWRAAYAQFGFVSFAFVALVVAFLSHDFSVANVAANSNSLLPAPYRVAATWGSHEGSLLLWTLMLAGWTAAVAAFSHHLPLVLISRVIAVMGAISVGFLTFMLATSNPFDRLVPPPFDGRDLNPLLQDPGMIFHPPLLYMGYVGFSVSFAFAIAALIGGRLDATWARWSRPWTTAAWCFLTLGIMLGSWWAYNELGWGGWWFWDPVENASLLPWLIGTALMHSLAVTEKRDTLKAWTVLLAISAFSLSLLGTFLVRSGILTSVHAFATDPKRGAFMLAFLAIVTGGSLALYAWRVPRVVGAGRFESVSRESALVANNILVVVAAGSVMLGTLYPLILDAVTGGKSKISVGPPYFDTVLLPILAPLVFLMGVGPLANWRRASLPALWVQLRWALGVSIATAMLTPLMVGSWRPLVSVGLMLSIWIVLTSIISVRDRLRHAIGPWWRRLGILARGYWGMTIAHLGVAVFVVGVTLVNGYQNEQTVRLGMGQSVQVGDYTLRFARARAIEGPNYEGVRVELEVGKAGDTITLLTPEKRFYPVQKTTMTEAAIDSGFTGDLYVSLGDAVGDGTWTFRVYSKPFITWIWFGCLLMALGGGIALSDRRYRARERRVASTLSIGRVSVER